MKEIGANEALDQLQKDPETVYLDVRSVPEFQQGHPIRAINIPILHFLPGMGMMPNEDFPKVVEANLTKETKLVVGCKTGVRSARACEILAQLGYSDVSNIRGGFVGVMDNMGRVLEPGWSLLDYPLCGACTEDAQYDTLATKAKL
ncbi:rhodanese-like domain-containing protein [bacterium]|nr:rhodanese-like domain-containing protein [bacterium]MCI0605196.1 rhodanese-like domain-containing protein [bacterium]